MAGRRARVVRSSGARRGQHFLASRALAEALVEDAAVAAGELVLDVGAGRGILTAALAERRARVRAIEADAALAELLRRRFATVATVTVVAADARTIAPPAESFVVVANLPFAGATGILRLLLDDPRVPLTRAVVVLQWEAARKLAAVWPSTLLTAYWGAWHELSLVRRLEPDAFAPPPSVAAGVLRVSRRAQPLVPPALAGRYRSFLGRGFARGPRSVVARRALVRTGRHLGFGREPDARDLDARQWAALFQTRCPDAPLVSTRHAPL